MNDLAEPLKKGFKQMLAEANAFIETISVHDALPLVTDKSVLFLDVREAFELEKGEIRGRPARRPRFPGIFRRSRIDHAQARNGAGRKNRSLLRNRGTSTLACKTLVDMGFEKVFNLAGGIAAWKAANGPALIYHGTAEKSRKTPKITKWTAPCRIVARPVASVSVATNRVSIRMTMFSC